MGYFMDFPAWATWLFGYIVPFLFVLTIVVFFHELGHFIVARLVWRAGPGVLDRLRTRALRIQ